MGDGEGDGLLDFKSGRVEERTNQEAEFSMLSLRLRLRLMVLFVLVVDVVCVGLVCKDLGSNLNLNTGESLTGSSDST